MLYCNHPPLDFAPLHSSSSQSSFSRSVFLSAIFQLSPPPFEHRFPPWLQYPHRPVRHRWDLHSETKRNVSIIIMTPIYLVQEKPTGRKARRLVLIFKKKISEHRLFRIVLHDIVDIDLENFGEVDHFRAPTDWRNEHGCSIVIAEKREDDTRHITPKNKQILGSRIFRIEKLRAFDGRVAKFLNFNTDLFGLLIQSSSWLFL